MHGSSLRRRVRTNGQVRDASRIDKGEGWELGRSVDFRRVYAPLRDLPGSARRAPGRRPGESGIRGQNVRDSLGLGHHTRVLRAEGRCQMWVERDLVEGDYASSHEAWVLGPTESQETGRPITGASVANER